MKKVKINPDYFFCDELYPNIHVSHKCQICVEYEFTDESSYDICPICGWEDEDILDDGYGLGVNNPDLIIEYKKQFDELKTKILLIGSWRIKKPDFIHPVIHHLYRYRTWRFDLRIASSRIAEMVDLIRFELTTYSLRTNCSPNWATSPFSKKGP